MPQVGTVERAFQIARVSTSLKEVRAKLLQEGDAVEAHLSGSQIKRDLKAQMKSAE